MAQWFEKLACQVQRLLPQHSLTALVYRFMRVRTGWIKNAQIRLIARWAGVNWTEAASDRLADYPTFNAFFTRELKPGVRPLAADEGALISPCDGRISEHGAVDGVRIFQAKGHDFSLRALVADDPDWAQWENGYFYNIYLSPRDYHRVHMPLTGTLTRMIHVPGKLFSVAPYTVRHIPDLFARNERVISIFDTAVGPVAHILVGAMLVASMDTVWAGNITPSNARAPVTTHYKEAPLTLNRGAEMGRFNMGSTVIMLLPAGAVHAPVQLANGAAVQLGQALAQLNFRDSVSQ